MPSPSLPSRPNLEQLKNRAKDLLRAYRERQPDALTRLRESLRRYSHLSDDDLIELSLSLRDAQRVIAVEHGFANWSSIRNYVERVAYGRKSQSWPPKSRGAIIRHTDKSG